MPVLRQVYAKFSGQLPGLAGDAARTAALRDKLKQVSQIMQVAKARRVSSCVIHHLSSLALPLACPESLRELEQACFDT